jgi:hypothetical protein
MTGQTKKILMDESIGCHGRQIKAGPLAAVMILLGRALSADIGLRRGARSVRISGS